MQKDSILYILDQHGVSEEDLKVFAEKLKKEKNFTIADCDKLLIKLGYEKVFADDDECEDDDSDGFTPYEKTKPKHHLDN
ncbi:MAG: hypothetical protein RBT59_04290 [Arcobacteraceae bacterium]|jgi:hypothetical protein|nr:hypothetical protein [Arcobacteraceae bacterium]